MAISELVRAPLTNGGLWFSDMDCARAFSAPALVESSQLEPFRRCLDTLRLTRSPRRHELDDDVFTYGPGIEIEARYVDDHGPRLAWIGFEAMGAPTLTAAAFEKLRTSGDPDGGLDAETAASLATLSRDAGAKGELAWLKVCLDEGGAISAVRVHSASSIAAAVAFSSRAKTWTFQPFLVDGHPIPVCAMVEMTYPARLHDHVEQLPLQLPKTPEGLVTIGGLRLHRSSGDTQLVPNERRRGLDPDGPPGRCRHRLPVLRRRDRRGVRRHAGSRQRAPRLRRAARRRDPHLALSAVPRGRLGEARVLVGRVPLRAALTELSRRACRGTP